MQISDVHIWYVTLVKGLFNPEVENHCARVSGRWGPMEGLWVTGRCPPKETLLSHFLSLAMRQLVFSSTCSHCNETLQAVDHFWKIELKQTPSQLTAFLSCYSDRSWPSPTVANVWKSLSRIPSPRAKIMVHTYNLLQPSLPHLPVAVLHRNNRPNATGYQRKSPKQSWECFNGNFEEENNIDIRHVEKL